MFSFKKNKKIRVRIAPSPTGFLHMGTARTALFNWLFAKHNGGSFILRIEDTDIERSDPKFEDDIIEGLSWLGINWDEGPIKSEEDQIGKFGPYRQSERSDIYEKYIKRLLEEKKAYFCYCTKEELEEDRKKAISAGKSPVYSQKCKDLEPRSISKKPELVRFKTIEKNIEFDDLIRGKITFDSKLIGDMAIAKIIKFESYDSLTFSSLYNFAVVVDDATMEITHVIRGEDHIPNTPKQILIAEALGFEIPTYGHLPLILSGDRSKMSKRYAETSLLSYREMGYLPEAMCNFIAFLGWHPKDDKEVMSLEEIAKEFEIERVQKAGAIFSEEKLSWFNSQYIKNKSDEELLEIIKLEASKRDFNDNNKLKRILKIEKNRIKTIKEFFEFSDFFFNLPSYEKELLIWKDKSLAEIKSNLENILALLKNIHDDNFEIAEIENSLSELISENGKGEILWPFRVSLSGLKQSPGPYDIAWVLGKDEVIRRLEIAIKKLL